MVLYISYKNMKKGCNIQKMAEKSDRGCQAGAGISGEENNRGCSGASDRHILRRSER